MNISLRAARADDYDFCWKLFQDEAAWVARALRLPPQEAHFCAAWERSEVNIVTRDGQDIGWLQTRAQDGALHLRQIFIAPGAQRRGIGTQVMEMLMDRPMTLAVVKISPAVRFYKRLGFYVEREDGERLFMRRDPAVAAPLGSLRL